MHLSTSKTVFTQVNLFKALHTNCTKIKTKTKELVKKIEDIS